MPLYDLVRDLPLEIDGADYEVAAIEISPEFTRKTTTIVIARRRRRGPRRGRHLRPGRARPGPVPAARRSRARGRSTRSRSTSTSLDLFPAGEPGQAAYRDYRRWAFESAALDLALQQAGRSLGDALGREARPLTFVSSTRAASLDGWLALYPDLRFKLDPTPEWTDELVADARRARERRRRRPEGRVPRHGRRQPGRPGAVPAGDRGFPDALDRGSRPSPPETDAVLEPHRDRITWDAPIHSWADVEALPFAPRVPQLQAVALRLGRAAVRVLRPLRRGTGSRSTAAASSSSASGAGRSSCSPGCSIRTARTTSRRAATTRPSRSPGLPVSPLDPSPQQRASGAPNSGYSGFGALAAHHLGRGCRRHLGAFGRSRPAAGSLRPDLDHRRLDRARRDAAEGEAEDRRRNPDLHLHGQEEDDDRADLAQVATQTAFDKAAKTIKGIVVPVQAVGADTWSANGTTLLVWKNGTAITIKFVGVEPFVAAQQSLAKTASGRL